MHGVYFVMVHFGNCNGNLLFTKNLHWHISHQQVFVIFYTW